MPRASVCSGNATLDAQGSIPGRTNGRENHSSRYNNNTHFLQGSRPSNRPPNRYHQRNNTQQGHSNQQNNSSSAGNSVFSNSTGRPAEQQGQQQTGQPNASLFNPFLQNNVSSNRNAQEGVVSSSDTTGRMESNGRPVTARRGRGDGSSRGRGRGAFGATSGRPFGGGPANKPTSGRGGRGSRGGFRGGRGGHPQGSPTPSGGEESDVSGDESAVIGFTDNSGFGNGENSRDKSAAKSVRAERFSDKAPTMVLFEKMKKDRVKERRDAIANGTIDDPDVPKKLEDALDFLGTCMDMCPEFERVERSVQHSVDPLELDPRTGEIDRNYAVKRFHRPAAGNDAQLPSDVRPPKVLVSTLAYLIYNLCGGNVPLSKTHPFIRDRTRAIRQDFTLQNYRKAETVQCHEIIARFHILSLHKLAKDTPDHFVAQQEIEQLQKTLTTLMELYEDARLDGHNYPNEAEFRSYQIITHIRDPDLQRQAQRWPYHIFSSAPVQMALKFFALIQANNRKQTNLGTKNTESCFNNFGTFFKLAKGNKVPYLMACLLETHFSEVRKYALKAMRGVYRRDSKQILLKFIQETLAYEDEASLMADCDNYGLSYAMTDPDPGHEPESYLVIHKGKGPWADNPPTKQSFHEFVEAKLMGRSISDVLWEPKGGVMSNETRAQLLLNTPHQRIPDPRALAPPVSTFAPTSQNGFGSQPPKLPKFSSKPGFGPSILPAAAQTGSGFAPISKSSQLDGIQSFVGRGPVPDSALTQGFSSPRPAGAGNSVFDGVVSNSSVFSNVPQQFPTAGSLAAGTTPFTTTSTSPPQKNPFGPPAVGPLKFATGTSSAPTPATSTLGFGSVAKEFTTPNSSFPPQLKPPTLGDPPVPVQPPFGPFAVSSSPPAAPSATTSVFQQITEPKQSPFPSVAPQPSAQPSALGSSWASGSAPFPNLFQTLGTPSLFDSTSGPASVNGGSVFDSLQNPSRASPASFVFPPYLPDDTENDDELAGNVVTQPYTGTPSGTVLNNHSSTTFMSSQAQPFPTGGVDQGPLFASRLSGLKQNSAVPSTSSLAQPLSSAAPQLPHPDPTNKKLFHSPARITELANSLFSQLLEKKTKEVVQDVMEENKTALAESIASEFLDKQASKIAANLVQEAIAQKFHETRLKEKKFVPWKRRARTIWLKRLRQYRIKNPPPPITPQWHPVQFPEDKALPPQVYQYINPMFQAPPLVEIFHPKVEYAFWATTQKEVHPTWRLLIANNNSEDPAHFWWRNKFLGQGMPRKATSDKATFEAQIQLEPDAMDQLKEIGGLIFGCSASYSVSNEDRFKSDRKNLHDAVEYILKGTSFPKLAIAVVCYRSPLDMTNADPFGEPNRTSGEGREKRLAAIREALGLNEFGPRVIGKEIILVETLDDIDFTLPMKRLSEFVLESVNPSVAAALAPKKILKRKRIPHPPMFANLVVPPPLNQTPKNENGDESARPKRRRSTPPDRHITAEIQQTSYIDYRTQKLDWRKSTGGALPNGVKNPVGEEILVTTRAPIQPTPESMRSSSIASLSAEIEDAMNYTKELNQNFDSYTEDLREMNKWIRVDGR
ncbi:hypothetical protein L873DRAFT_1662166 [Choiromyces venosus 120613-1]|uniref:SAC3/GANP/THP3 conserved domain-containing protein n=1 Tax=Choiromyces venosus 120613-1 TaxID=1336337 RepID=A0A3N4K8W6_9PEZI|nr:hypothetical protein L873DRAFT_1662166 [Choiromyces venosus 120613-1]